MRRQLGGGGWAGTSEGCQLWVHEGTGPSMGQMLEPPQLCGLGHVIQIAYFSFFCSELGDNKNKYYIVYIVRIK